MSVNVLSSMTDNLVKEVESILPAKFRRFIEDNFYRRINEQAVFENFIEDQSFHKNPVKHAALYSDHGVVHVQDVAKQVLQVIQRVNGVLIPLREERRLQFMKGYGVAVAYPRKKSTRSKYDMKACINILKNLLQPKKFLSVFQSYQK